MAMSLTTPLSEVPVLSPTRQPCGNPARRRLSPVRVASSQATSRPRAPSDSTSPSSTACMSRSMAEGVVVSRGSPGIASLRMVSRRSRRLDASPSERANAVQPAGPPMRSSSRLPAVLSLSVITASHTSASVMPGAPVRSPVTGEYATRSSFANSMRCASASSPRSTRASTAATASSLKVLHIGKRSSPRWSMRRPVAVSRMATPRRPPCAFSSAARRASGSPAAGVAADARARVETSTPAASEPRTKLRRSIGTSCVSDALQG